MTRGLLVLVNREDELAGVLGHEMGHVLARHAAQRVSAGAPFAVLFGAPAAIVGSVSPALGGVIGGTGRLAAGFVLAPYSREQERDADRLGMELAARGGWDPLGLGDFLETLAAEDALEAHAPDTVGFFSTHPSTPDRTERIRRAAGSFTRTPATPIAESRGVLLGELDGLVVGDNPAYGALEGSTLRHPADDLALELPAGWKIFRTPEAVGAIAPGGDAIAFLQGVASAADPVSGARADGLSDPLIARLDRIDISGLPAARLAVETHEGERLDLTWIAHRRCVVRFAAITEVAGWERHRTTIERALTSVRPLSAAERDHLAVLRLRVRPARAAETVEQVVARNAGAWSAAMTAIANRVGVSTALEAGWPVKIAVRERFSAPASCL